MKEEKKKIIIQIMRIFNMKGIMMLMLIMRIITLTTAVVTM